MTSITPIEFTQKTDKGNERVGNKVKITSITTEPGESVDVFIQDQTTPPIQYYLMNELKTDITLTSDIAVDDTVISVSAGHGFTGTGEYMVIRSGQSYIQSKVISVATNDITIQIPSNQIYTVANTEVLRGNIEMNVNGSVTPVVFRFPATGTEPVDIKTIIVNIHSNTASDDSKFGDLVALTNGLLARKIDNLITNLGIFIRNGDFREYGANINYTDKAGGGDFSTVVTFDMLEIYGVVIRLDPTTNDQFTALVQDNLSTLTRVRISVMGQITTGEAIV